MTNRNAMQRRSVQVQEAAVGLEAGADNLILSLASVADSFWPWGSAPKVRDRQLREFWPTEPILASALYSIVIRNAAFHWTLEGPERTVAAVQEILQAADFGRGWRYMVTKLGIDLFSQDNGAFMEIIRARNSPEAPVVGIAHLDAFRCTRTADPDFPVVYIDRKGVMHKLAWYQVTALSEFPSPVETMFGMQLCAVSRVLRAAQLLRDIGIYQREKVAGDNPNAIYLVGGVNAKTISDAMEQHKAKQAERGMTRYIIPLVVASMDPTADVSVESIDLKSLPDGFNVDDSMRWYINQLALGFGADYQDFAPLPGRNLGSSTQSMVLHEKSRGRGPAMFMAMVEQVFNFQGILPSNVVFKYDEQDVAADMEQADLEKTTAETLDIYVKNGTLTPGAARQVMLDKGMLSRELFDVLQEDEDVTPDVVAQDDEPVDANTPSERTGGVRTAARRKATKIEDCFHYLDHDKRVHCEGAPGNPYVVSHVGKRHKITLQYARGHGIANKPQWFKFSKKLGNGWDLASGVKIDGPPTTKETDDLPVAFAEEERVALEATMEREMAAVLDRAFRKARRIMGLPKAKFASLLGMKQEPPDIFTNETFWADFQLDAVTTMLPLARQGALEAAQVNLGLGIAIDMDLVNAEVLGFSERYATAWWDELELATQNSLRNAVTTWQEGGLGKRGLPDLTKAIEPTFGRARANRIAVTEVTQIFDEGNRLAHNAGGIEVEEWQTVEDSLVEEICRALDGQRFPTNEGPRPVKDTHIGCILPGTRVAATGVERAYRAWYDGPVLELTFKEGQHLTLTPNHPVLTPEGWLAAELLRPGGDVVGGPFRKGVVSLRGEDVADSPPFIEEVFAALSVVDRVFPTATEFHGDGRFMDGDIDIVGSDGELRCACGSAGLQPLHEEHFVWRVVPQAVLERRGVLGLLLGRGLAASHGLICRLREGLTLLWSQLTHALTIGLRPVAWHNASFNQALAYEAAGDSERSCHCELRLAIDVTGHDPKGVHLFTGTAHSDMGISEDAVELGHRDGESLEKVLHVLPFPVRLNQIVSVTRREYSGHVYDLQTDTALYQTAGAIVHNCRCARIGVGADDRVIGGA